HKPVNTQLQELGVKVVLADLHGLSNKLVELLSGIDVVISAIYFDSPDDEILLANAAKAAGVTRFIQSALMSVIHRRVLLVFGKRPLYPSYQIPQKLSMLVHSRESRIYTTVNKSTSHIPTLTL